MSRLPGSTTRAEAAVRVVAGLTAAYSVAITVRPTLLAKPVKLTTEGGRLKPATAALIRSIGSRDTVLAVALLFAPPGRPLRLLSAARVGADLADAVWFGKLLDDPRDAMKVAGAAAGWAALEAAVALAASRAE